MPELEDQLTAMAGAIEWPATPPHSLWGPHASKEWGRSRKKPAMGLFPRHRWALAGAALLLIVAISLAYTPTRDAVAAWLNLHTRITRTEHPPTPSIRPTAPLGRALDLGTATTLAGARAELGWPILVPSSLGTPDTVYIKPPPDGPSGSEVTLVYSARGGIAPSGLTGVAVLITEARGQTNEQFFGKTLGPGVTIEPITVSGHSGYWMSGQPHSFVFTAADGTPYFDTLRLATNTLVLDDGGTVVRIEGDMTRDQATEIGRSLT